MKEKLLIIAGLALIAFIGLAVVMQFMKAEDNPPVTKVISAPDDVMAILRSSCFDCHSNETRITWLQKLPIVSSMVASDVKGARSILNFTEWDKYTPLEQDGLVYLAVTAVENGQMPPDDYVWIHPNAKITKEDKAILKNWLISLQPGSVKN